MNKGLLLLVAGIKGAIGSTLAVSAQNLQKNPDLILPYLMTGQKLSKLGDPTRIEVAGWDCSDQSMPEAINYHRVLAENLWKPFEPALSTLSTATAPNPQMNLADQIDRIAHQIKEFCSSYSDHQPVFINLLPAASCHDLSEYTNLQDLRTVDASVAIPDLAYAIAAIESGIPVVNFTPNEIEIPAVIHAAQASRVPIAGRDGKTGQTYLKVVLASALRARHLLINGWYSANILGNADGENLMDPDHAACKLNNKTDVLENVLGYTPGQKRFGKSVHKVIIDYYPPRGDAKEAWDVIDFEGIMGLNMSLRVNLHGRDSILAVPMVLDLARWAGALGLKGMGGPIPELAFYFKAGIENSIPHTFEDQLAALDKLEQEIDSI
jgi:myo-inositol-1-phosphate synthase